VLLLHGLLHLSGMDHEVDEGEMAEREGLLRAKLRLPSGLIARVEGVSSRSPKGMTERKARTKASDAKGAKLNGKLRELKRERVAARKKVVA
jgi:probable rRNA maturation factor